MARSQKPFRPSATRSDRRNGVLYARVSSKEQEKEGFSIPAQLKLLRGYAEITDLAVVQEFVDVETAKQAGRTDFGKMVSFLKETPDCRVLLVEKTDRLYRNLKDWVTLDDLVDLEIHFVKESVVLSRDSRSSEKFMHGIKVLMAKNYIDNLSEETRKGMLEKAEQGIWPSYAPLGYLNVDGPDGKKRIEPDPETASIIVRLFEKYAAGNHSLKEITKMARDEGLVSRKGAPLVKATIHKILRNRIYMGGFDWNGETYKGVHVPLMSQDLWDRVQEVLDHRFNKRHRKSRHDFAFSGLISCGHCGCSLVAEIKKGRYVYYHCTGYKGKCPEPYTREEVLEERFSDLLRGLSFDDEVMGWVTDALRQSHGDEKRHHDEAVARLQAEYNRLQNRIDTMYVDKLDGRVDAAFFDRKAAEWRSEQDRILRTIEEHQSANQTYLDEGVQLLELARKAHMLFRKQKPSEKRRLLNFVLSNCTWKGGELQATYRQPFDMLAVANTAHEKEKAAGVASNDLFEIWLPGPDSNQRHGG
jgi:site-specific DNA recombinase